MADSKGIPNPFADEGMPGTAGVPIGGLLATLRSILGEREGGAETLLQLPEELRVTKDSLHEWGHFVMEAVARNMGTLMTASNLPEMLTSKDDTRAVTIQTRCDDNTFTVRGFVNNTLDEGRQEVDASDVLFTFTMQYTPNN